MKYSDGKNQYIFEYPDYITGHSTTTNDYKADQINIGYSNIISQNNSSAIMSSIGTNQPNRYHYENTMQRTNKIQIVSDNASIKNDSLSKRGGIRVVSRNNSHQKKSDTSIDKRNQQNNTSIDYNKSINNNHSLYNKSIDNNKSINNNRSTDNKRSNDNNKSVDNKKSIDNNNSLLCGLNCTQANNYPFLEHQTNQVTIPNLRSLQTLKSQVTYNQMMSDRQKKNRQKLHKSHQEQKQKIYTILRSQMQGQISVARKMFQKKLKDQVQSINICYKSDIQILQQILAQNKTLIDSQSEKLMKLQQKIQKKSIKLQQYQQKFVSITKYIQSSGQYTTNRISQLDHCVRLLTKQLQINSNHKNQSLSLQNKISYLQSLFGNIVGQTIIKYRTVQYDIKNQVKQIMKNYQYFEEKVYQMDLLKNLGKENQIQNYRILQQIQNIKQQFLIHGSKQAIKNNLSPKSTLSPQSTISPKSTKQQGIDDQQSQQNQSYNQLKHIVQIIYNKINLLQDQKHKIKQLIKENHRNINKQNNPKQINQIQSKLNRQILQLNEIIQQCDSKIQQLHTKIQHLQHEKKHINDQRQSLKHENQRINGEIQLLKHQNQKINRERQLLSHQNKGILQQVSINKNLFQIIKQNKLSIEQNTITIEQYQNTIEQNKTTIEQKQVQIQQLHYKVQTLQNQIQQLNQALDMSQGIFDQQISKFKQSIQLLQDENSQLLTQINNLNLTNSLSKKSENEITKNKCKSPKRQKYGTVTMQWFKNTVDKHSLHQNVNISTSEKESIRSDDQREVNQFYYPKNLSSYQ